MTDEGKTGGTDQTVGQAADELARSVTDLVSAAFGVGAAVAKSAAQATSAGRTVPEPKASQGPLGDIVHYGVSTLTNVLRLVVAPAQTVRAAAATAASSGNAATGRPSVSAGSTLRVPLSIENPSSQGIEQLEFRCLRMDAMTVGQGERLGVANVRLEPTILSIAPRDFEKLTVFVDTLPLTAPGTYRAVVGTASFQSDVEFEVAASPTASG